MVEDSFEWEVKRIWDLALGDLFAKIGNLREGLEVWANTIKLGRVGLKRDLTRKLEQLMAKNRDDENLVKLTDTKVQHINTIKVLEDDDGREVLDVEEIESLVANEDFQHILRVLNTNVDGKQKIMFALTSIKGIGRRFANIVCKKADVDMNKRAGELTAQELDNLMTIVANPRQFKIPDWFLNRQKDYKDGKYSQVVSNALDMKLRDDLERLKKIRNHRGLRHYWGLRVRGQHTKTTGRRGKTVGVSKKR
ncbi:hypothetical protein Gotri_005901 [Gossypium trilobum]|uniref:40S ribosomal protein S18 n=1 Tax=Gossypium trilobum TaxID=34281 RepID=A0A7J9EZZ9_9ROSI|nr:hypothetical protein [Gossypium trilobum]